ncbi:hypothetical protein JZU51_02365, partial [bacterium]|nr:hypothetical protein [bacterium]
LCVAAELFVVQGWSRYGWKKHPPYSTTCCKWIYGADFSLADVSSVVDSSGIVIAHLAQDD